MKNLETVISDYLSKPTEYSIQLVGNWGNGKTFYYRRVIEPIICAKDVYSNARKKYKPIYISLFGLKSVEDISNKIVLDFYQSSFFKHYSKSKNLRITQNILQLGFKSFINLSQLGNAEEFLTDIKRIGKDTLDSSELVICFDDLERINKALSIEDLMGYANSLIDNGIKVLLICNENLMLKSEENYKHLKEKIIGITIEFIPDIKQTISNIIDLRYSEFKNYHEYLYEHIDSLVKFSNCIENNFRHFIYALDTWQNCFSFLKKDILDIKHDIGVVLNQQLFNITITTLAISVEYKSSNLKHSDINEYNDFRILNKLLSNNDDDHQSKYKTFIKKYHIDESNYQFFETIFNYVTGSDEFDVQKFILEFSKRFNLQKGIISPQYQLLKDLSYDNFYDLSDEEYREKTIKLIAYAHEGLFTAVDYLTVMHFAERLDNILKLDLESVRKEIIEGLTKSIRDIQLNSELTFSQFEFSGRTDTISDNNKIVYQKGIFEINLFRNETEKNKSENLATQLFNNIEDFRNNYYTNSDFLSNLNHYSFLEHIDPEQFFNLVIGTDKKAVFFLRYFFEQRYKNTDLLRRENDNFQKILNYLTDYCKTQEAPTIRNYLLKDFVESLSKIRPK